MSDKKPLSRRKKFLIGGLLLGALAGWQLFIQPVFTCPYCEDWCGQVKVPVQPVPTCKACEGSGRVTYRSKLALEQRMEALRAKGQWGP